MKLVLKAAVYDLIDVDNSRFVKIELEGQEGPSFQIEIVPTEGYFDVEIHHSAAPGLPPIKLHVPDKHDLESVQKLFKEISQVILSEYDGLAYELRKQDRRQDLNRLSMEHKLQVQKLLRDLLKAFAPSPKPRQW